MERLTALQRLLSGRSRLRVLHVTRGLFGPDGPPPTLAGARMASFVRMLGAEHTRVSATVLDTDLPADRVREITDRILAEWHADDPYGEVCYRDGVRHHPRLSPLNIDHREPRLDPDAVYLVTGGTRGLGARVARHLVSRGARKLALLGLRPLPSRDRWRRADLPEAEAEAIRNVQELERGGARVMLHAGPLTRRAELSAFLSEVRVALGDIDGVVHCAGRSSQGRPSFVHKHPAEIETALEPKVDGLEILAEECAEDRLSFVVLFSSICAAVPKLAAGVADYAAANTFMDLFTGYQLRTGRTSFRLRSTGRSGGNPVARGPSRMSARRWASPRSATRTGCACWTGCSRCLPAPRSCPARRSTARSTPRRCSHPRWSHGSQSSSVPVSQPGSVHVSQPTPALQATSVPASQPTSAAVQLTPVSDPTSAAVQSATEPPSGRFGRGCSAASGRTGRVARDAVLADHRHSEDALDPTVEFGDLGVESVMLAELVQRIEEKLGINLDPSTLLDYPTLLELSDHLRETHGAPDENEGQEAGTVVTDPGTDPVLSDRSMPARSEVDGKVAVIGMACRFPGATDVAAFWDNLTEGRCAVGEVPLSRWDPRPRYRPEPHLGSSISKWGGFVEGIEDFDPSYFGMKDDEARTLDPAIRMFLESCATSLSDAGYEGKELWGRRVGIFAGARMSDYGRRVGIRPGGLASDQNFIAARVAHHFDFRGPNLVVDSACSSSLVAVQLACQSLLAGESRAGAGGRRRGAPRRGAVPAAQRGDGALARRGAVTPSTSEPTASCPARGAAWSCSSALGAARWPTATASTR